MGQSFGSARALLVHQSPVDPVVCLRPQLIVARARRMLDAFPGAMLYAVKCNDSADVLRALWAGGIREFDTASIGEIRHVRACLPDAACHFMHPVKSVEAIAEAYHVHGVRRFVVDHPDELAKVVAATDRASDLELFVRLAVPGEGAMLTLTGKFGVPVDEATGLVRKARGFADVVGLTFHVGSQCIDPQAFRRAIALAGAVVRSTGPVDHLDVGGGFPARYTGTEPEFEEFVAVIEEALLEQGLEDVPLECEPGRALVADGASVIARVELRRGRALYLNDGVYGNLAELKWIGPQFPMRLHRLERSTAPMLSAFDLFGPTCDSIDSMPGPHHLASDAQEGDWVEVGMMGAYSNALRTRFNGFGAEDGLAFVDGDGWYVDDRTSAARGQQLRIAA